MRKGMQHFFRMSSVLGIVRAFALEAKHMLQCLNSGPTKTKVEGQYAFSLWKMDSAVLSRKIALKPEMRWKKI